MIDLIASLILNRTPLYWPIAFTAFILSAIASWYGCKLHLEESTLPNTNLVSMSIFLIYLSLFPHFPAWIGLGIYMVKDMSKKSL